MTRTWAICARSSLFLFLLLTGLLLLGGCGVKADPVAAPVAKPSALAGLDARGREGALTLSWRVVQPQGEAKKVLGFRVYRKRLPGGVAAAQAETLLMADLEAPKSAEVPVIFQDQALVRNDIYEYHIFPYDTDRKLGGDTVVGPFTASYPEKSLTGFRADPKDGKVVLSWLPFVSSIGATIPPSGASTAAEAPKAVKDEIGVNLYRAEGEKGPYAAKPLNPSPILGETYSDFSGEPGTQLRYKAAPVRVVAGVALEGALSQEVSTYVVDQTPPPPANLMELKVIKNGVRLLWEKTGDDALGYHVERRARGESGFKDVSGFITVLEFTDRTLSKDGYYGYRVVSRDRAGNRSFSPEREVAYPDKENALKTLPPEPPAPVKDAVSATPATAPSAPSVTPVAPPSPAASPTTPPPAAAPVQATPAPAPTPVAPPKPEVPPVSTPITAPVKVDGLPTPGN